MEIVVCPAAFKECLSSGDAASFILAGLKKSIPRAKILKIPLADGGGGTVEAVLSAAKGSRVFARVTSPDGKKVRASYALLDSAHTALIEMSAASGLALLPPGFLPPRKERTRQG